MNFYVRKLGHQECSYTAGKGGGHRGRYILISHKERHKESKSFLPIFDPDSENRSRSIGVIDDTSKKVTYCFFNWHKGLFNIYNLIYLTWFLVDFKLDIAFVDTTFTWSCLSVVA